MSIKGNFTGKGIKKAVLPTSMNKTAETDEKLRVFVPAAPTYDSPVVSSSYALGVACGTEGSEDTGFGLTGAESREKQSLHFGLGIFADFQSGRLLKGLDGRASANAVVPVYDAVCG